MKNSRLAAVFTGKELELRSYPLMAPAPDGARLRLVFSGICGTDLHILQGRLPLPAPFIPGHEFVGRIDALGIRARCDSLGNRLRRGDVAIACVADPCGRCFCCRQHETANCLNFGITNVRDPGHPPHLFGGFAEALHQPVANLVRVPVGLNLLAVAAFACAGPTIVHACGRAGGLRRGELVIVQGGGPVGLFAAAWAAAHGCRVGLVGSTKNPARMRLARRLGATKTWSIQHTTPETRATQIKAWAKSLRRGDGADVVIEASGAPAAIPEGLGLLRTLGRYIVPGQYSLSGPVTIQPQLLTFRALTICGSGQYTIEDIHAYLRFLQANPRLQPKLAACVTHRHRVSRAVQAIATAAAGKSIKAVFAGNSEA